MHKPPARKNRIVVLVVQVVQYVTFMAKLLLCRMGCHAPKCEPQKWNDPWPGTNPDYVCCQGQSNCYSYACNKHT